MAKMTFTYVSRTYKLREDKKRDDTFGREFICSFNKFINKLIN